MKVRVPFLFLSLACVSCSGIDLDGSDKADSQTPPSPPVWISVVRPASSPGLISRPTISVLGVAAGLKVSLYSDSTCTTEIGSATAADSSLEMTVNAALPPGSTAIYARSSNAAGASECSSASAVYQYVPCPSGYIAVLHNDGVATNSDFCVAQYEMKCSGSSCPTVTPGTNAVAVSQAAGSPWVSLTQVNAKTACTNLGANYDLISNPEWMTIARDAEALSVNWKDSIYNTSDAPIFSRGWSAAAPYGDTFSNSAFAPSTGPECLYNTGANTCGATGDHMFKRTLILSSGEEIWDLAGNAQEWVDWSLDPGLQAGPTQCADQWSWINAFNFSCSPAVPLNQFMSLTSVPTPRETALGQIGGGPGGAARRGGAFFDGRFAGVYTLYLYNNSSYSGDWIGFRCVYRP